MTRGLARVLWYFALALVTVAWMGPVLWIVSVSFRSRPEIVSPVLALLPRQPTLENFREVIGTTRMPEYFVNSLIIAGTTTVVGIMVAALGSYVLARGGLPGRRRILSWMLSLRMVPPIAIVVPFYMMLRQFRLQDTYVGMVVAYLPLTVPFALWLLYGYMRDLPQELDEAAALDGCTPWQAFWRVLLPSSRSSVAVAAVFTFIAAWNEFLLALILTGSRTKTFAVGMSEFILSYEVQWGQLCAATILFLVPLLGAVYVLQRHIIRSLTMGAVQ